MVRNVESDQFVALARKAMEEYVRFGRVMKEPAPLPPELAAKAGVFVCLKKHGQLRGCIGTIEPAQPNLAAEIIRSAISASTEDPRFEPVSPDELEDIDVSVDVLTSPEAVDGLDKLDAKRYGVIVESGYRRGLLLPDLEGVDTVEEQVAIAMRKAGILNGEPINLYRFEVKRHGG